MIHPIARALQTRHRETLTLASGADFAQESGASWIQLIKNSCSGPK